MKIVFLVVFTLIQFVLNAEDYYKLLGVPRNADEAQIKKAFKKLSIKYHPDKNKDKKEWAKQQFVKIANAYETLSDPEKRRAYDLGGEEGVQQQEQRNAQGGGGGFNMDGDFSEMFSQFFGGGGGGGSHFRFNRRGGSRRMQEEEREINFFENTDVLELTINSLTKILNRKENWFILFYKSKDAGIKELTEMWKTLAEKTYGIFKIASCNCKEEEELCEEFSIYSTSEIVFFPETGDDEEKYKGLKQWEKIFQFGSTRMQSFVRTINNENYGDFITSQPQNHKVLLFTSKKVTPPLLKAISKAYRDKLNFGEVRQSETELIQRFKIDKFPSLIVISDGENYDSIAYDGPMSRDSIEKFLNKYAYENIKVEKKATAAKELTEKVYNSNTCNNNDNKNICFVYVVKEGVDIESKDMQILNTLTEKYKNDPFLFFYFLESKYGHLWSSFEPSDKGSDVLILKGKRKKYIPLSLKTEDGKTIKHWEDVANDTIDKILSGSGKFKNMMKKITFSKVQNDDL